MPSSALTGDLANLLTGVKGYTSDQSATAENITALLEKLTTCGKQLYVLDREVEDSIAPEAFRSEYDSVLQYEERITECIARLRLTFERLPPTTSTPTPAVSPTPQIPDRSTGVRLQRLQLRKFRGDFTEWQPFWDEFKANVHDNRNLTKSDKFHYLRSLLLGTAEAAISGLQTTEAAYDDAIALLTQRFGDRGRLEEQYLGKLRTLPHVKSSTDTCGLRKLHDYVQTNICGLRSLGIPTVTYSSMMTQILLAAIPSDIVLEYHRLNLRSMQRDAATPAEHEVATLQDEGAASTASAELNKVLAFLKAEVESRERSGLCDRQDQKPSGQRKTGAKGHASAPSAFALHNQTVPTNCLFCKAKSHATENCNADMSQEDKKKTWPSTGAVFGARRRSTIQRNAVTREGAQNAEEDTLPQCATPTGRPRTLRKLKTKTPSKRQKLQS
ncbi:uncharacterized protein LOC135375286 [Ornithodoros turicata]|uniref:uncharacterized protein LOC135375286 n=1 Tax=Ornithodoros turicata TaxID=34597 RepID=UPI00313A1F76